MGRVAADLVTALLLCLAIGPCIGGSPPNPQGIWPDVDSIQLFRPNRCGSHCKPKVPADRLHSLCNDRNLTDNDLATFWVSARLRGFVGRDDLGDLRMMGVRAIQLHRCIVDISALKDFLDKAWVEGLSVFPELPSRLYLDSSDGCFSTDFNCYYVVRSLYRQLLATSVAEDGEYHPAIEMVLLAREPDLETPLYCVMEGCGLQGALQAMVTAWDGMLDAENELGINPGRVRVAATFATAAMSPKGEPTCHRLRFSSGGCAGTDVLRGFWLATRHAPGSVRTGEGLGNVIFTPHNNLEVALPTRWLHTFGAASGKGEIIRALRDYYDFITPELPATSDVGLSSKVVAALLEFNESIVF